MIEHGQDVELLDQDGQVGFDPHTGRRGLYQVIQHDQDVELLDQDGEVVQDRR